MERKYYGLGCCLEKYLTMIVLTMLIVFTYVSEVSGYVPVFSMNTGKGCDVNYYDLKISVGEDMHIGSLNIKSESIGFGYPDSSSGFFEEDNLFRNDKDYLEYFDMNSSHQIAEVTLRFENRTEPKSRLMPGTYPISISTSLQRKDDTYIPIEDLNTGIMIGTFVDMINASVTGRHGIRNRIVMGENFSVHFSDIRSDLYTHSIRFNVKYHDKYYRSELLIANDDENQTFPEFASSMTEDLKEETICPRENMTVELTELCAENMIQVSQDIPEPSDIYHYVGKFFESRNPTRIPQIYYMVAAYFNCRRDDARAY